MNETAKNAEVAKKTHWLSSLSWRTWRSWRFNLLDALNTLH